jgi:lipid II:glycine glycyltransferase (peptidoglycan interpeptide bridge formation enzyme)
LPDISDKEALWNDVNTNIRRNIQKAKKKYGLKVQRGMDVATFIAMNKQVYIRQGLKPYHLEILERLITTTIARDQGQIWAAFDADGQLHAAVFVIWQDDCAYYIAGSSNTQFRKSGGMALALWQAIGDVSQYTNTFDFEGSMVKGIEHFFREFGAKQMSYFSIYKGKINWIQRVLIKLKYLYSNK